MNITFNSAFGTVELRDKISSIFDIDIAGQIATNGEYYTIHVDHITHELYALTKESRYVADALGYPLAENEVAEFNGEKVRAMTFEEESLYNTGSLHAYVDLWGNVAVDKPFNISNKYEGNHYEILRRS